MSFETEQTFVKFIKKNCIEIYADGNRDGVLFQYITSWIFVSIMDYS